MLMVWPHFLSGLPYYLPSLLLTDTWTKISKAPGPEPHTRAEFLQYSQEITLDPNTANRCLLLSDGNRKVTVLSEDKCYSSHPDRFTGCHPQVLSRESLSGCCYWEVEWRGGVRVAVTYKYINRAGESVQCLFGDNDKSWFLYSQISCHFRHNSIWTGVSVPDSSARVGVHLDHRAGLLSFYRASNTMILLHRVQTTFTQPLYAGVCLYCPGDTAEFCKLRLEFFQL
ncbi:stonustoxin subunit beta-like [Cynoglossus semilaevis]|uniref:stonustoxin subunit beta-like n=1 Tax=Cynoglossus semilaevis TaxID=244447 RepID=UPI000D62C6CE|nr:stonustoxin subunit beta-like [Cynoglossus semilaevis]